MRLLTLTLTLVLATSLHAQTPDAATQLNTLRQQAQTALDAKDNAKALTLVLEIQRFLHDSPNSLRSTSRIAVRAGDNAASLAALRRLANMGLTDESFGDPKDPRTAPLQSLPAYPTVLAALKANAQPLSHAEKAFDLTDPLLVAEDIDYDPATRTFFITSILEKKIISVTLSGEAVTFATSQSGWPMMALRIDSRRHLLWATEVALADFAPSPKSEWGNSAILCYDLRSNRILSRTPAPHTALGDMTLAPNGDPILSDGTNGGIYRLHSSRLNRPGTLTRIDTGDFISPQTPSILPGGTRALIPDYVRGLALLDLTTHTAIWLNDDGAQPIALAGIDGAILAGHTLLITQNGVTPERVLRLDLDPTFTHITSQQVIERATPTLGEPTHGVVIGPWFYYIANSGWTFLNDDGTLKPNTTPTPAHIMRYRLQ